MSRWIYLIFLIICTSFTITAVYGIEMSVSTSNANGALGASNVYGAKIDDVVKQEIEINPLEGEMSNHWYFTGSGSGSRYAYGSGGSYARSGFSVEGLYGRTGTSYEFTSTNYPAHVTESLTSTNAHKIYAYGEAGNSEGDYVKASIEAHDYYGWYDSNLVNYRNDAYATSTYARVWQAANSARGDWFVRPYVYARDYWDNSYVQNDLKRIDYAWNGYNNGYYGKAEASRYTDYTNTWQYTRGYGNPQYLRSRAYQSYGGKVFYDYDDWYSIYSHGYYQRAYTTTTSGGAYNLHLV